MSNLTLITGFFLMGFSNSWEMQMLQGTMFLLVYLVALMGNILIFTLISLDRHLHTSMYFFLKNLSFLDLCLISVTLPKFIANSLNHSFFISFSGCVAQFFLMMLFAGSELFLLTAMSYDRYAAICLPLHYEVIMNRKTCVKMTAASWIGGSFFGTLYSATTFNLPFCGSKKIHQFFCDVPSILRIACSDTNIAFDVTLALGVTAGILCFISITISYGQIFTTILKIPNTEGKSKAFSTCLPHLIVLTVFITTAVIAYLKPPGDSNIVLDLSLSMFYTVVPLTMNPLIYSLRNKDMNTSLKKLLVGNPFQGY